MWKCQLDEVITTTSPASFQSSPCHSLPRRCSLGFVTCSFPKKVMEDCLMSQKNICVQRIKKVVSDSPGQVDFAIRLVNSVISLPDGQVKFLCGIQITEELWNPSAHQGFWYFVRSRTCKIQVLPRNSAKFPKKREIPQNPPEIFPNKCRQNIFNTYLGY